MEFRYRTAQAIVFGLPVLALQWGGSRLGGAPTESERWIAILQALLAGWVTYVGAAGMLAEGVLLLPSKFSIDLPVAAIAVGLYLFSLISTLGIFFIGRPIYHPLLYHWCVVILAVWCRVRWRALDAQEKSV